MYTSLYIALPSYLVGLPNATSRTFVASGVYDSNPFAGEIYAFCPFYFCQSKNVFHLTDNISNFNRFHHRSYIPRSYS